MSDPSLTIHVWSDVVCPWCYVGKRRLETALDSFAERVDVVFHSFELDPRAPTTKGSAPNAAERLAKKYGMPVERALLMFDQMKERGRAEGIDFNLAEGKTLSTFHAHRLLHLGLAHDKQVAMKERLFLAHFTEAQDLGDTRVLAALGREVGLPEDELEAMLEGDGFAAEVREDEATARELGITGVPFFVVGRYGISGAQPSDVLKSAIEKALREEAAIQNDPGADSAGDARL